MDREQAKVEVKAGLRDYLEGNGINTRRLFPCMNPDHHDRNPSMSFDRKRNKVHCFSCKADYDTFDVIGIDYGLNTPAERFAKAYELFGISFDGQPVQKQVKSVQCAQYTHDTQEVNDNDLIDYLFECADRAQETDYFSKRGISPETVDALKLGYDPKFATKDGTTGNSTTWKAVVIPTSGNTCTIRNIDPEAAKVNRLRKKGTVHLFKEPALWSGKPVFVVEGEFDALSVMEAGAESVGLGSLNNTDKFLKAIKEKAPSNTLIISLDNDEQGQEATKKLANELQALGIPFIVSNISGTYKDPNESLQADREAFIKGVLNVQDNMTEQAEAALETEKQSYLNTNAASHLPSFINGIKASVNTPYIPTGFTKLDGVLDGGFYEGLYVVGAISSLGKTTFILQIADNIARHGNDILIFSLEMARAELMAKSISRLTFIQPKDKRLAKTTRGITTGKRYDHYSYEEQVLIQESIKAYGEYAQRIYIHEGIGDIGADQIREAVQKHIAMTGNHPVVIIDYLQLLAPNDMRASDKQNMDKSVMELKRITRDYKVTVIAISSLNRQSYKDAVSMASFKESGAIEYSSDVLLGLQAKGVGTDNFNVDEAKAKDPREIELKVLKNRNGATGDTIGYEYYPAFNFFREG